MEDELNAIAQQQAQDGKGLGAQYWLHEPG
jgi:hypothetical protein